MFVARKINSICIVAVSQILNDQHVISMVILTKVLKVGLAAVKIIMPIEIMGGIKRILNRFIPI